MIHIACYIIWNTRYLILKLHETARDVKTHLLYQLLCAVYWHQVKWVLSAVDCILNQFPPVSISSDLSLFFSAALKSDSLTSAHFVGFPLRHVVFSGSYGPLQGQRWHYIHNQDRDYAFLKLIINKVTDQLEKKAEGLAAKEADIFSGVHVDTKTLLCVGWMCKYATSC